jgi:hypothetical protein
MAFTDLSNGSFTRAGFELTRGRGGKSPSPRGECNAARNRVFRTNRKRSGMTEQLPFGNIADLDAYYARLGPGEGSCLIESYSFYFRQVLKHRAAAHQYAFLRRLADAQRNSQRRR